PPEPERGRPYAVAECAVRAVRAAVRVGAGDERAGENELLLGEVEVEDPVARRRVVRRRYPVPLRELTPDAGLLVVGLAMVEDEMVVGDSGLARANGGRAVGWV